MANTIIIQAVALYKAPHWTAYDPNNQIAINVDRLNAYSPRNAWIKRYIVPGQNQIQYLLTFEPTSAELLDVNLVQGIYIEVDGVGVVIDCISIANFVTVANGTGTIQQRYGAVPTFVSPTSSAFCIARADDGSAFSHGLVSTDYVGQYIGNVLLRSSISGVSHYTVTSYTTPVAIGSDTVTAGACSS